MSDPTSLGSATDLHVDLVGHDYAAMREYLVERRPADEPNAGKSGDYGHYSEPHTMVACPFAEKCHRCDGNGRIELPEHCPRCGGSGWEPES